MEWLHEGRDCDFVVSFLHFGASHFPIKSLSEKPSKSYFTKVSGFYLYLVISMVTELIKFRAYLL